MKKHKKHDEIVRNYEKQKSKHLEKLATKMLDNEEKFNKLKDNKFFDNELINDYDEPEWGFPKGRRNRGESDVECAKREFWEETNITDDTYTIDENLKFVETFRGTNNILYRHIYFVALLKSSKTINTKQKLTYMQSKEISEVGWKTLSECRNVIRPHYVERLNLLTQVERMIATYQSISK